MARRKPRTREQRLQVKRDQERERRLDLVARGICTRCACADASEGKQQCQPCLAYQRERMKRRYEARKESARCVTCGAELPARPRPGPAVTRDRRPWERSGSAIQCSRCRQAANRASMRYFWNRRIEWIEPLD